eukprot:g2089.t1
MSSHPERPKRKAAIEARARLYEQAETGRRKQHFDRNLEQPVINKTTMNPPSTPHGAQLVVPNSLPHHPSTNEVPRLATGGAIEVDPRQEDDTLPPVPNSIQINGSPEYLLDKKLGKGGFGQVYLGRRVVPTRIKDGPQANLVAIKLEHKNSKGCNYGPPYEWNVYNALNNECKGIPRVHYKGCQGDWYVMIMDVLGPSLWDKWTESGSALAQDMVACIAMEAIGILKDFHSKGYVHGDIKPENFLLGSEGTSKARKLYLVDFGLATMFRENLAMHHVEYDQKPDVFRGTVRYASVHAHLGRTASRRDDLESLAYTLLFLLKGRLPWQGFQGELKGYNVCKKKMATPSEALCRYAPCAFKLFTDAVISLKFQEDPKYDLYIGWFNDVCTSSNSIPPLLTETRPGHKRAREEQEIQVQEEAPKKRMRLGSSIPQWITVYNSNKAMKQRYHYNVTDQRVAQHIAKGNENGLQVTAVGCATDLWALIMDAGTDYTEQLYNISDEFLPKDWILEHWEEGYYITSMAGSNAGGSLIVMSKNSYYTQQSYKVADCFPFKWINKKWKEGFHVTSMASANEGRWAVVMSRGAPFVEQCVELDFQYPSEGIHLRWDAGYRITSCAATADQVAMILSVPRIRPLDETQETLRTTQFPSAHVKDKWNKNLYIAAIAYGRTVS